MFVEKCTKLKSLKLFSKIYIEFFQNINSTITKLYYYNSPI